MTTLTTELKEISNPSAVAWEWSDTYQGIEYDGVEGTYEHQIVWLVGQSSLYYVTKPPRGVWGPWVSIRDPERFGFDGTLKGARTAAETFYKEGKTT